MVVSIFSIFECDFWNNADDSLLYYTCLCQQLWNPFW